MTRTTKTVIGSWLMCASALAACVDNEPQSVGTDSDGGADSVQPSGAVDTDATAADSSAVPPGDTEDGGSGAASAGSGVDTSTPGTTGEDMTAGVEAGCSKVDLLFVIDSGSTMKAEQQGLVAAFPGFYDSVKATLGMQDTHVMAVGTDDAKALSVTSQCLGGGKCFCGPAPTCCTEVCGGGNANSCNSNDCATLQVSECASQFGAGREHDTQGAYCNIADGRRYLLDSQPELHATFGCVAETGLYDSPVGKQPMFAATEAVGPTMNGAGGCDEGFLRSDALLVVVFVSDKDDGPDGNATGSPGGPQEWYDALVAAKGGNAESIVMLGLVGDGNMTGGACAPNMSPDKDALAGSPAPRLQEFAAKFTHNAIGSICAADYTPFFTNGVALVQQACEGFIVGQ
ncbi:hypothetical protein [Nannocystis sp. SCPEA4]|uniref:hypothetical protein n=1 Tax=Nannocystis sp. SCPEA4 TaxID=2996787 RepID=UPI002271CC1D|nr:hypothetical protein [Nannocystis sp. SCPEA4]MCY1055873.1 hypothetical protein [Nannocystis sp. SCPEA4]